MWGQVFLLLPELARLVSVRLLLRQLLIPFLETGSLTTLLLHDVFSSFFCLLLGSCILAGHFVFTWGCTDIGYCMYDICGLWIALMVWFIFMAMCMDICMDMCIWLLVYGFVYVYVFSFTFMAMCMGIGS